MQMAQRRDLKAASKGLAVLPEFLVQDTPDNTTSSDEDLVMYAEMVLKNKRFKPTFAQQEVLAPEFSGASQD